MRVGYAVKGPEDAHHRTESQTLFGAYGQCLLYRALEPLIHRDALAPGKQHSLSARPLGALLNIGAAHTASICGGDRKNRHRRSNAIELTEGCAPLYDLLINIGGGAQRRGGHSGVKSTIYSRHRAWPEIYKITNTRNASFRIKKVGVKLIKCILLLGLIVVVSADLQCRHQNTLSTCSADIKIHCRPAVQTSGHTLSTCSSQKDLATRAEKDLAIRAEKDLLEFGVNVNIYTNATGTMSIKHPIMHRCYQVARIMSVYDDAARVLPLVLASSE